MTTHNTLFDFSVDLFLGPITHLELRISEVSYGELGSVVNLTWDLPPPTVIVENYSVSISPAPLSHPTGYFSLTSPPLINITLMDNVLYTVNLTAMNCVEESEIFTQDILLSESLLKWKKYNALMH